MESPNNTNGGPLFSCSWTLDHLSSKLGFDGIADFINDEGDCVWSNSEVVGQARRQNREEGHMVQKVSPS
jgi:hypothetical protein